MPNRLIHEKSPYLLQHAHNPVDWFPWGEEAFAKARAEDKPIFLSIGYSTCHWCHVMEHESFEDEEVAELMNRAFVSIKVDREERPDIDHVYMTVAHMTTGRGGWPLNVLLTPDREPFLAGTYFPKSGGRGRPGMLELIPWVESVWRDKRSDVVHTTKTLKEHIARYETETRNRARLSGDPGVELLDQAFGLFADRFDAQWGGFGTAPKFPSPHMFQFLLRVSKRTGSAKALAIVETSLERMRLGGLFDQIGGGFHRYSTDREWLLPHFEKMLYDQATQLFAYAEAHLATGKPLYRETAEAVVEYVLRDMTGSEGAFFAAEDADSEGEEGKFYVFGHEELGEVLGADADFAAAVFGVRPEGNFHDEATGELTGGNILHLKKTPDELAADFGFAPAVFAEKLAGIRERLFAYRAKRVRPHLDDKILVDWNGLFIAALAFAGRSFGREGWVQAAAKAFAAIRTRCVRADGTLYHRMKDGEAGIQAGLDDYAFLCLAAVELHQATLDPAYVEFAVSLAEMLLARFRTEDGTGFHLTPDDGEALLFRPKDAFDGAAPSGNSIAMQCLLKLARIAGRSDFAKAAEAAIRALVPSAEQNPLGLAAYLCAASAHLDGGYDVEVTAGQGERDLVFAASAGFAPGVLVFRRPTGPSFTPAAPAADGAAQARLCRDGRCEVETKKTEIVRKTLFNA